MNIVTGAAGFIGSCIVARLNELGREDLVLVDHFRDGKSFESTECKKKLNLVNKKFIRYYDKEDFLKEVLSRPPQEPVETLIHMGACSSTTLQDAEYFEKNNYQYTLACAQWALRHNVRYIYASSAATYGDGSRGYNDDEETTRRCAPLNLYGASKQKFDLWALENGCLDKITGLKFFNVFGPNEYHKGDMRSVVAKAYPRVVSEGTMFLFKSYKEGYADGEQKRDFIYVKDAVDVVLFFWKNPETNGIFNVGTGTARTWNDLARAIFTVAGKPLNIQYGEMPESLRPRYQYFTQANMSKLKAAGYDQPFTALEEAVKDYASYLTTQAYW